MLSALTLSACATSNQPEVFYSHPKHGVTNTKDATFKADSDSCNKQAYETKRTLTVPAYTTLFQKKEATEIVVKNSRQIADIVMSGMVPTADIADLLVEVGKDVRKCLNSKGWKKEDAPASPL